MSVLAPMMFGLIGGLGCAALVVAMTARRSSLADALDSLAEPNWPTGADAPADLETRIATTLALPRDTTLRADLAVLGRTPETHAIDKVRTALFWSVTPLIFGFVGRLGLFVLSPVMILLATLGGFVFGWFLSDTQVRQRAAERRREFRSTLISYLQLVSILLAGGAGINQALSEAAAYGQGWSFEVIQRSLRDSQTRNISPWDGFGRVADELGLGALSELAAAMRLAGESGAHVRESLLAKSESLRVHELSEIESEAAAASEKMGGPVGGMVAGFVITMGYPAFAVVLAL